MKLSVSDIDWTQLSPAERETLEQIAPRLEEGYSIAEIAGDLDVDVDELTDRWENLAARVMALSGSTELPAPSEEEFEALVASIDEHGQRYPILRGSPSSALPGVTVDGHQRERACARLRIEPVYRDVDGDADQLRSLGLVLNLARRHLSASSRRGIVKAELLRDATRSDRAIAAFVGVTHPTVAAIRRELENAGDVERLSTRTDAIGREQPARRSPQSAAEPPREQTIKVAIPLDLVDHWVGIWVNCRAFRLAERRAGLYELEVQLLDPELAGDDQVAEIARHAAAVAERTGHTVGEAIQELLRTAREVFAREIPALANLTQQEAEWLVARIGVLAGESS